MLPGRRLTFGEMMRAVRRGKWTIVVCVAVVGCLSALLASQLPDQYQSSTLIRVLPPQVLQEYVPGAVAGRTDTQQRLQSVREQILARTSLEDVIKTHNLYGAGANPGPAVARLRNEVSVELTPRSESFQVSFAAPDPRLAMKVTARLADLLISGASKDREELAEATSAFLDTELEDARRRLAEHERRIEDYRLRHAGELPSELQSNLQQLSALQTQAQNFVESANLDRLRRLTLERTLADVAIDTTAVLPAQTSPATPGSLDTLPPGTPPEQRLAAARDALRTAELRLTEGHPDVVRLRRVVANLEAAVARAAATPPAEDAPGITAAEMQRRNRMRELRLEIENLDRQVAFKQSEEQRLRREIVQLQARVDSTPRRESELAKLTRDYDTLQTSYRTLLAKRESSKIGENLGRKQVGDQFRVVEAAFLPTAPTGPNRPLFDLGGAVVGLLAGLVLVLLLALADRSLKSERDVNLAVALRVVGSIPDLLTDGERTRRRMARAGRSAIALATLAAWLLVLVITWR